MYLTHVSQSHNHYIPNNDSPQVPSNRPVQPERCPVNVVGIPSVTVQHGQLIVGDSESSSTRSYTPLKVVGDGSFGTVWLCDWHGTLPPNTPLSAMQCGAGARPEYANKRLVALKRMKRRWDGGWDECKRLKELESLRAIPFHPNIIPLYDFFLLPSTKELYFVFESMEGNLYQLIKSRKSRPLAGGLVSSIFSQTIAGLHHIHVSGYFHRDMKPENLLVTTTGLYDYRPVSPIAPLNAPPQRDVVVLIKLADFGLARETRSKPPYTEYVSTRWYRAPEVLLRSTDYSNPVDMWALGTIMAELVNLRPLFPGQGEMDQVARICEVLGDPSDDYGRDARGKSCGGGKWSKGIKMARSVGFAFPKIQPKDFNSLFDRSVPVKLVECIADLLKYDPDLRLTSKQCLEHPYLLETGPKNNPPILLSSPPPSSRSNLRNGAQGPVNLPSISSRNIFPSLFHPPSNPKPALNPLQSLGQGASNTHRSSFYPSSSTILDRKHSQTVDSPSDVESESYNTLSPPAGTSAQRWSGSSESGPSEWDAMDIALVVPDPTTDDNSAAAPGHSMGIQTSPMAQEYPNRPSINPEPFQDPVNGADPHPPARKFSKLSSLAFSRKPSRWPLSGMFSHVDKGLPSVDELNVASLTSTPSLKRTSTSTTGSRSLSEASASNENPPPLPDPKKVKKEAERVAKEAEMQRRALTQKMQMEQARAVMQKRKQALTQTDRDDLEWKWTANPNQRRMEGDSKGAERSTATLNASSGRYGDTTFAGWLDGERSAKARRRDLDDDHSMSSSELASVGRMSSMFGMNRASTSSLRTSFDDFPRSARSSNSLSLEQQLVNGLHIRGSIDACSSLSDHGSPPIQSLSIGSPQWQHQPMQSPDGAVAQSLMHQNPVSLVSSSSPIPQHSLQQLSTLSPGPQDNLQLYPPSPGAAPKSAINPIFKVPPNPDESGEGRSTSTSLPPFSHIEAVANGEYRPLSQMSFILPEDIVVRDDG